MKNSISHGWTFQRVLYLVLGGFIIVQSIVENQWFGILLGIYFAAMGLFAFGCAAGNCFGSTNRFKTENKPPSNLEDVKFEEIKTK